MKKYVYKSLLVTLLIGIFPLINRAQGIQSGAYVVLPADAVMEVRGDFSLYEEAQLNGLVRLTGNLADQQGLTLEQGEIRFIGQGDVQLIGGQSLTILHDLTIDPDASVKVPAGKSLTVMGALVNQNPQQGLVLTSDEQETASLIHHSPSVHAEVRRRFPDVHNSWHYISSPVEAQQIEPEFIFHYRDRIQTWYEPQSLWVSYDNESHYPTFLDANEGVLHFLSVRGYYMGHYPGLGAPLTRVFSGPLHQGQQHTVLSAPSDENALYQGYQLLGNPYPSAIDWLAEEGWTGKEFLAGESDKRHKSAWVWNARIGNFGVIHPPARHVHHNDVDHHIPAMQGFWVQAAPGTNGEIFGMDDRVRVHSPKEWSKGRPANDEIGLASIKPGRIDPGEMLPEEQDNAETSDETTGIPPETDQGLRITLSKAGTPWRDEVIVEFGHHPETASAQKLFPEDPIAPQLYVRRRDIPYSILLLDEPENHRSLSLVAEPTARGEYILSVEGISHLAGIITVTDIYTGEEFSLTPEKRQYRFSAEQQDKERHFSLSF